MRKLFIACLACLAAALFLAAPGATAQEPAPQRPFGTLLSEWNQALELAGRELVTPDLSDDRAVKLKQRLSGIRTEAMNLQANTRLKLTPLASRLEALGPPPSQEDPPEFAAIAEERSRINGDMAVLDGHIKQAALIIKESDELIQTINARSLGQAIDTLLKIFPSPLAPSTLSAALPEFLQNLGSLARAPLDWWRSLPDEQRDGALAFRLALVAVLAVLLGIGIRYGLLHWLGRDPSIEHPAYARRLTAGISEGLASGIIPALMFGALLYRVNSEQAIISGRFAEIVTGFCIAMIVIALGWALPRAVLAPELPTWRLVDLSAEGARAISRLITFIAVIFAIDLFFSVTGKGLNNTDQMLAFYHFAMNTLEAAGVLALVRSRWWLTEQRDEEARVEPAGPPGDETATPVGGQFWTGLRLLVGAVAIAAVATAVLGYSNLSTYLIDDLLLSGVVLGLLFLVRGLAREAVGAALRSRSLRDQLALSHTTRRLFKFWLRALLDLGLFGLGIFLVLTVWDAPVVEMVSWLKEMLAGVTIGNVTISLTEVLVALAVLVVALVVTRILQRVLAEQVLPNTSLDSGIQHSLSAGFGYVGLVIAVMLSISALGLDLTNLALIFGALSVGIGFGLQNVANNFVSGLILLIERPIKTGDWVVVGTNEGFVKRIRLRATEIETFQRASIVIPNSEIVSYAVTNWTHKDRYGRVDVPVRVAYGSDPDQVREILMKCLRDHPEITGWPAPDVLLRHFGENGLEFEARGFLANIEAIYQVQSVLMIAMVKALAEAGIEIPVPKRDLTLTNLDQLAEAMTAAQGTTTRPGPQGVAARLEAARLESARLRRVESGEGEG